MEWSVAEYWIVDLEARAVEVNASGAKVGRIERHRLAWQPITGQAPLTELFVFRLNMGDENYWR